MTEEDVFEIATVQEMNRNRNKADYSHSKLQRKIRKCKRFSAGKKSPPNKQEQRRKIL